MKTSEGKTKGKTFEKECRPGVSQGDGDRREWEEIGRGSSRRCHNDLHYLLYYDLSQMSIVFLMFILLFVMF